MELRVTKKEVTISLDWNESIFSFKREIVVPINEITKVSTDEPGVLWGIRLPGTHIPFYFRAGTFYTKLGKEFWYYRLSKEPLVIETKGNYKRIVLGLDDAKYWCELIDSKVR